MTDRINSFCVVLEHDYRDDDAESIKTALGMVKGVLSVEPNISNHSDYIAESRVRHELTKKLLGVIRPEKLIST